MSAYSVVAELKELTGPHLKRIDEWMQAMTEAEWSAWVDRHEPQIAACLTLRQQEREKRAWWREERTRLLIATEALHRAHDAAHLLGLLEACCVTLDFRPREQRESLPSVARLLALIDGLPRPTVWTAQEYTWWTSEPEPSTDES